MIHAMKFNCFFISFFIEIQTLRTIENGAVVAIMINFTQLKLWKAEVTDIRRISSFFFLIFWVYVVHKVTQLIFSKNVTFNSYHIVILRTFLPYKINTLSARETDWAELFSSTRLLTWPSVSRFTTISYLVKSSYCMIISKVGPKSPLSSS